MDLREKKTKRSITNSFLEIRSGKPLERITIKEICEKAEISKATFYLHYKDIYDLSETLQLNVVRDMLKNLSDPRDMVYDPCKASKELIEGFYSYRSIVNILFSGSQFSKLPETIEKEIKKILFSEFPELKTDIFANVHITYRLMGSFYSFYKYEKEFGFNEVFDSVQRITELFIMDYKSDREKNNMEE